MHTVGSLDKFAKWTDPLMAQRVRLAAKIATIGPGPA